MELREIDGQMMLVLPLANRAAPEVVGYFANMMDHFHAHETATAIREGLLQDVKKWHKDNRDKIVRPEQGIGDSRT